MQKNFDRNTQHTNALKNQVDSIDLTKQGTMNDDSLKRVSNEIHP